MKLAPTDGDSVSKRGIVNKNQTVPHENVILRNFIRCAISEIMFHRNIIIPKCKATKICHDNHEKMKSHKNKTELMDNANSFFIQQNFFRHQNVNYTNVMEKNGEILNEAGYKVYRWLEKGVFPCLDDGFLKSFIVYVETKIDCASGESNQIYYGTELLRQIETFHFELSDPERTVNQSGRLSHTTDINCRKQTDPKQKEQEIIQSLQSLRNYLSSQNYIASQNINLNQEEKFRKGAIGRHRECNTSLSFVLEYSEKAPMEIQPEFFTTMMRPNALRKVENDGHSIFPFLQHDHLQLCHPGEASMPAKSETSSMASNSQKRGKRCKRGRNITDQNTKTIDKFKNVWAIGTFQIKKRNVNIFCQSTVHDSDKKSIRDTNIPQHDHVMENQTLENVKKPRIKKTCNVDKEDDSYHQYEADNDEEYYSKLDSQRHNCGVIQTDKYKNQSKSHDKYSSSKSPQAIFNSNLGYTGKQRLTFSDEKKYFGAIDATNIRMRTPKEKSPGTLSEAPTLLVSECFSNRKHPSLLRYS